MEYTSLPLPRIDPSVTGYSAGNAYTCALAAWLSYFQDDPLLERCRHFGMERILELSRPPNHGVLLGIDGVFIVAFRGTDERADLQTNVAALPTATTWGRVHNGFQKATDSFWPELPIHVGDASARAQPIWLSGHSLGGAIATLATAKLTADSGLNIQSLYTFGQPPAGYIKFTKRLRTELSGRYFRIVNHRDAVVEMGGLGGFSKHAGQLRYFDRCGSLHTEPNVADSLVEAAVEVGSILSSFGSLLRGKTHAYVQHATRPVTSHFMAHYLQLLSRQLEQTAAGGDRKN